VALTELAGGTLAQLSDAVATVTSPLGPPADQPDFVEARSLQGMSLGFHIITVCFAVGFPLIVLTAHGMWLKTGDPLYKALAKRWSKVMLVLFSVGAVSGTILSFELGMLWPEWMAAFGDVFGLAFAFEGFSFFTEAIFIAIYVYGWDRLPNKTHFLTGIPIVITGAVGSFFIIAVNGFMNEPKGFDVVNGEVVNVNPWEAMTSGALWHTFVHMYLAGIITAALIVASVYAWSWLRGNWDRSKRVAFTMCFTVAALVVPIQLLVGDWAARYLAENQPVKLAAAEGLADTEDGAAFSLFGWYSDGELEGAIEIPYLLSLLADHDPNGEVVGLNSVPVEDQPPVNVVHYAWDAMIGIGSFFALMAVVFLFYMWRYRRLPGNKWFYLGALISGPLAVVAVWSGWIVTEVGRQPWIVYNVMRSEDAVTGASGVAVALWVLLVVYLLLAAGTVWALRVVNRKPLEEELRVEDERDAVRGSMGLSG
jgi:cytochrome d ubiquinol oxidase subunit I